jgi:phage shock protein A
VRVVKAYVSNFTEQFEDPEVMLDRVTDEMQEDLIKMRQATAKVRDGAMVRLDARLLCCTGA